MNEYDNKEQTKKRLEEIEDEIQKLKETEKELSEKWNEEKHQIQKIQGLKADIEEYKQRAESLERDGNLEKVAEIRYGTLHSLEKQQKTTSLP